jgi:hypothetical protein
MTIMPLAKLLASLDAMLAAEDLPGVQEAEVEIWEYLSAFDGLTAQTQAIDELAAAFQERPASSPLHDMICHHIAQHKHRLTNV